MSALNLDPQLDGTGFGLATRVKTVPIQSSTSLLFSKLSREDPPPIPSPRYRSRSAIPGNPSYLSLSLSLASQISDILLGFSGEFEVDCRSNSLSGMFCLIPSYFFKKDRCI